MILISTLRKMIARDPRATVCKLTTKAHHVAVGQFSTDVPEHCDYFATDRAAGEELLRRAEVQRLTGLDPAVLNVMVDVLANDAAKAQGFDFLRGAQ